MAKVEFKNIKKSFGDVEVVKEFDFTVEDGEFVVFLGPSGCGKSTTLRMLAGLESISSGDIVVGGKVMNKVDAKDRDLAMVFQSYALYPHMTVYENIAFALKLKGMPKAEIRICFVETQCVCGIVALRTPASYNCRKFWINRSRLR